LRSLVFIDGLTGVANRRHFDEALQAEWRRCRRNHMPLAVLMIDIDHFKRYNDHYGHQTGDACLQAVAGALQAAFGRAHDLVARYGGEEFVCLMPECDAAAGQAKAEELRRAVVALGIPHEASPTAGMVTISLGIAAAIPEGDAAAESLLAAADAALYAAKSGGRNRAASVHEKLHAPDGHPHELGHNTTL
jgi:diguanylate cyclase (GGDEF)-like protein